MRAYLHTAPRWVLCLVYGVPFGAVMSVGILSGNGEDVSGLRGRRH